MKPLATRLLHRAAALLLLAAVPAALWAGLVVPLSDAYKTGVTTLSEKAALYARYRAIASQSILLENAKAGAAPAEDETLGREGEAVMQASLQSTLQSIITASGASFLSAQNLPQRSSDGIDYLGVQLVISAELGRARELVEALERHRPYLFIEQLDMRRQGNAPEDEAYQPVILDVTMDVFAPRPVDSEGTEVSQ